MTMRERVADYLERPAVTKFIMGVILFNAVLLGLETSKTAMAAAGGLILTLDPAQGPTALDTLEGWPSDAPEVWVALLAGAIPERGALYRVSVESGR